MNLSLKKLLPLVLFALTPLLSLTQDNCSNATVISTKNYYQSALYTSVNSDYSNYCTSGLEESGRDAVWKFSPPASGCYTVSLQGQLSYTQLSVLNGCPNGAYTCIGSDNTAGIIKQVTFNYNVGDNIYIIADCWLALQNFEIISQPCDDGNTCSNAINIPSLPFDEYGTTCDKGNNYSKADYATNNPNSDCNNITDYTEGEDIVYKYIPTENQCIEITFIATQFYSANLYVRSGCIGDKTTNETTCIFSKATPQTAGQVTTANFNVYKGEEIYIYLDSDDRNDNLSDCMGYYFAIQTCATPVTQCTDVVAGDDCASAPLLCDISSYCGTIHSGYTPDLAATIAANSCGTNMAITNNSWLKFIATKPSMTFNGTYSFSRSPKVNTTGSGANRRGVEAIIYETSDCVNLTKKSNCVSVNSTLVGGAFTLTATGLTFGQEYYIMLDSYNNSGTVYSLSSTDGLNYPAVVAENDKSTCNGVSVDISATGGDGTYTWKEGATTLGTGTPITVSPTGTTTYTVESNQGFIGCTTPTSDNITVSITTVNASATKTDPSCANGTDGTITASGANGTAPYTYSINGTTYQALATFTGLSANTYTVYAKDVNGCIGQTTITLNNASAITVTSTATNPLCVGASNGTVSLTATGGTPGYTYSINGITYQASNTFSGLAAGNYTFTVKDANGCTQVENLTLNNPTVLSVSATSTQPLCTGAINGTLTANATGGLSPYTYSIDGLTFQNPNLFSGLGAGAYTLSAKDANGCIATTILTLTDPLSILVTPSATSVLCNGGNTGAINITQTNGTAPFTYQLDGGSFQNSPTISSVAAGTYTVTVKDVNGCLGTAPVTVTEPLPLQINTSKNDATCNGGNDGSITATALDGVSPYAYSLDGGLYQTVNTFTNLVPGVYLVNTKDANGCISSSPVTITSPSLISATVNTEPVSCNGDSDGKLIVSATGGVGSLLAFVNGSIGLGIGTLSNYPAGTYNIEVKDIFGCSVLKVATISEPDVLTLSLTKTDITCTGGTDGTITATAAGGNGSYEYSLDNSTWQSANLFSNLAAGPHTIYVRDAKNCTTQASITIADGITLDFTSTSTAASCNGGTDGSITVNPSNGTAPYTFEIVSVAPSQTSNIFNGLAANSYDVVMTDANGCSVTKTATVTNNSSIVVSTVNNNPTCFGGNDGQISISATGGTPPYTYSIDNSPYSGTTVYTSLIAKTYPVMVKDSNGCEQTTLVTLTQPSEITITANLSHVKCEGDATGVISAVATGGSGNFQYNIDGGTYAAANSFSNLSAGTYTIYAKDNKGCVNQADFTITEPNALSLSDVQAEPSCNGGTDGQITLTAAGGTSPYEYKISALAYSANNNFNGLSAGTHTLFTRDANNCEISYTITLGEPSAVIASGSVGNVSCFNGTDGLLQISATGGTVPYTYSYNANPHGSNSAFSNLSAGTYTLSVIDSKGCEGTTTVLIAEPSEINATSTTTDVICYGEANGTISVNATGGTSPYIYQINTNASQASNTFNVPAGSYTVTVSDANGCTKAYPGITVNQPNTLSATTTITNVSCNGENTGGITVLATDGVAPYQYALNAGPYTNNATFNSLTAGTYTIDVKDANDCVFQTTISITEPTTLALSLNTSDYNGFGVSCNGGNNGGVTSTVTGGTAPYSYSWNNGITTANSTDLVAGTYTVTVTDANGCTATESATLSEPQQINIGLISSTNVQCNNAADGTIDIDVNGGASPYTYAWDNGETTQDLSNLTAGNYTLVVSDANNCTQTNTFSISQPNALQVNLITSDASCAGLSDGSIQSAVSGGTGPYTFSWNNGETTADINTLSTGTYTVNITDANGCTVNASATINEPSAITSTVVVQNALCNGDNNGSIDVSTAGGLAPYTYAWNTGSNTEDLNNVGAGVYDLTITDANGCSHTLTDEVEQPAALALSATIENIECQVRSVGNIKTSVTGGTAPYTYAWNNGATTKDITNLPAGNYQVNITDANACTIMGAYLITEPSNLTITETITNISCNGETDGAISLAITGGATPYSFTWNNGETTKDISNLAAGTYSVIIGDANNCEVLRTYTVTETNPINISAEITNNNCYQDANGIIDANASNGGTGILTYTWDNGSTGPLLSNLVAGNYTLTITDENGCSKQETFTINEGAQISLNPSITNVSCFNGSNGEIQVTALGGSDSFTITAVDQNGKTFNEPFENLPAGTYTVTATDNLGCSKTEAYTISQPTELVYTTTTDGVICSGTNTGKASVSPSGGTAPYVVSWEDGTNGTNRSNLATGKYAFVISDANACSVTDTVEIIDIDPVVIELLEASETLCDNTAEGTIRTAATGGEPAYTFQWTDGYVGAERYNLNPGTYTLNVTDNKGCTATVTHTIRNVISPNFTINVDPTMCDMLDGTFSLKPSNNYPTTVDGVGPGRIAITGANGEYTAQADAFGTYTITVSQENQGCVTSKTETISFSNSPTPSFHMYGQQPFTTLDTRIIFENTTVGAVEYTWDFGFATKTSKQENPTVEYPYTQPGKYTVCLDAMAANGCSQMICKELIIKEQETVYIPNAFTPGNGDGRNDIFKPVSKGVSEIDYDFRVFNRWGEEVYYTTNPNEGWDGLYLNENAQSGVYAYRLTYRSTTSGFKAEKTGHVTLIR